MAEQEAHEALYEMEMAALEAQRVAEATEAALEDSDDDLEPLRIADAAAQQEVSIDSPLHLALKILKIGRSSLAGVSNCALIHCIGVSAMLGRRAGGRSNAWCHRMPCVA